MTDLIGEYGKWLARPHRGKKRGEYTIEQYMGLLRRMDREMPCGVASATLDELVEWIYGGTRGDTTHAHYTTIVKGFAAWATDPHIGRLDFHFADELPEVTANSAEIRPATEAEFADIRGRAVDPWLDLYELAGWAGLRCVEICRVEREHMTKDETRVLGKGSKWRAVPTHPILWERFAGRSAGPLARGRDGVPLSRTQVIASGDRYLRRGLGLRISMHQLRKRFAQQVYRESGHDIRLVQYLLGHRFVNTTQRYLGVDGAEAAAVVGRLKVIA